MTNLMIFEGKEVEVFELNGQVLFNPYHCGQCWDLADSTVRYHLANMNSKQAVLLKNSDVQNINIRNLNNAGENFLTESGVYWLILCHQTPFLRHCICRGIITHSDVHNVLECTRAMSECVLVYV